MSPGPFEFQRDTFAFVNELFWEYRFDSTGRTTTFRNNPPPAYAHRCFVMVRSARQFFYHARFEPERPAPDETTARRLIREVMARNPRVISPPDERVVIPGSRGLRDLSEARGALLKAECGGAWQSYFLRSHWRMVFPFTRRHQAAMARQLVRSVPLRGIPIVHLVRFPQLTINHGLILTAVEHRPGRLVFPAYDPNIADHPVELVFAEDDRTFHFSRTHYWPGGRVDVVEIYCGGLY